MAGMTLFLMLQFVISTKAGLVNYVQGTASVKATQSVATGVPIKTGPEGFAEILLNPGSFLRLGQNSEAILDSTELTNISLRVLAGTAVIEAGGFTKETPLKVRAGDLNVRIIKDGIYVVEPGQIKVADGQVQLDGETKSYKKGWVVSKTGALKFSKTNPLEIELWSRSRSNLIAVSNANISNTIRRQPSLASSFHNVWLWDPSFGGFTFIPGYRYRSPYGYHYRSVQETYYNAGSGGSNSNWGGGSNGGFSGGGSGSSSGGGSSSGADRGVSISSPAAVSSQQPSVSRSPDPPAASRGQRAQP
jgi:uncharacterized membrane protein YgcG